MTVLKALNNYLKPYGTCLLSKTKCVVFIQEVGSNFYIQIYIWNFGAALIIGWWLQSVRDKELLFTQTRCALERVAFPADTSKWSGGIDALCLFFRTNTFHLTFVCVRASCPATDITLVAHTLVSRWWLVAQTTAVAGRLTQQTGCHTDVIDGQCTIQTRTDMSTRGVDTFWKWWTFIHFWETALIHVLTGKAIAIKTFLAGAKVAPNIVYA